MNISEKKLEKSQVALEIELSVQDLEPYRKLALENLAKGARAEGFRPGHVPVFVAERQLGEQAVLAETAQLAVQKTWQELVRERELDVIGEPRVEVLKLAPGNPLEFRIQVALVPEVQLPNYKKIAGEVSRRQVRVQEKEVEEALEWLQKSRKTNEGATPEMNDDFAREIGNFENVAGLKESVREGLQHEKDMQETDRLRQEILENIAGKTEVEIPEVLVEREKQALLQNIKQGVGHMMQVSFEEYLKQAGKTEQEVLDSFQEEAEKRVKRFLVVREVAQQEAIQPERQEVEEEANKILAHYKSANKAHKELDPARLKEYTEGVLRHEKTLQFLEGLAR